MILFNPPDTSDSPFSTGSHLNLNKSALAKVAQPGGDKLDTNPEAPDCKLCALQPVQCKSDAAADHAEEGVRAQTVGG